MKNNVSLKTVSLSSAVFNILAVLSHMMENGEVDNSEWYRTERENLSATARELGFAPIVYISAIASFSPSIKWKDNVSEVKRMGEMVKNGASLEDILSARFMGYGANVRKAYFILKTGDISILSGPKVERFRNNLMGNVTNVTIDRHACNIAINGLWCGTSGQLTPTKAMYKQLERAYIVAAKIATLVHGKDFTPASVQAITWGFVSESTSNHTA